MEVTHQTATTYRTTRQKDHQLPMLGICFSALSTFLPVTTVSIFVLFYPSKSHVIKLKAQVGLALRMLRPEVQAR